MMIEEVEESSDELDSNEEGSPDDESESDKGGGEDGPEEDNEEDNVTEVSKHILNRIEYSHKKLSRTRNNMQ